MISLYKVSLNGNYNVFVKDLNFEFTPSKPSKLVSDAKFEASEDIKPFLGEFLVAEKQVKTKETTTVAEVSTASNSEEVKEVPKVEKVEETVVNATNASKTSSADDKTTTKTLVEEKKGEKDDTIVDATDASKSTVAEKKDADTTDEVVKADGASKKGAKTKAVETKVEVKKETSPVENKPAKKAGRPKKNK